MNTPEHLWHFEHLFMNTPEHLWHLWIFIYEHSWTLKTHMNTYLWTLLNTYNTYEHLFMNASEHLWHTICTLLSVAVGAFLFETRLGCLEDQIPARTQQFIDATQEMMSATLYLIVGEKLHKKLNTPFWKKHKVAWDKMFDISELLVFTMGWGRKW